MASTPFLTDLAKTVDGILSTPGNKAAWFKDPDGNIMALIQGGTKAG